MNTKSKNKILRITYAAIIAALYTALTHVAASMGLSSGVIQIRLSEILTVLPYFTPAAIPGLTVGCLVSNLTTGCIPVDVILGTAATFIGAVCTYALRKQNPMLSPIPPIIANILIVPWVLKYVYGMDGGVPYFMLTVGIGEVISCGVLGLILLHAVKNRRIFKDN